MKHYLILLKKKNKLEKQIAKLCNKFTESTGLIIHNAEMDIDIQKIEMAETINKLLPNYTVKIFCEI